MLRWLTPPSTSPYISLRGTHSGQPLSNCSGEHYSYYHCIGSCQFSALEISSPFFLSIFRCIQLPTTSAGDITKGVDNDDKESDADLLDDKVVEKSDEQSEVTKQTRVHNITIHVTFHDNGTTITSL